MKYYDPLTCKRPMFSSLWKSVKDEGTKTCGGAYIICNCGVVLQTQQITFEHWQQGHFDVYDEVKDRKEYSVNLEKLNREQ